MSRQKAKQWIGLFAIYNQTFRFLNGRNMTIGDFLKKERF